MMSNPTVTMYPLFLVMKVIRDELCGSIMYTMLKHNERVIEVTR